jgi:SAM-dependent methyltransferase
MAGESGGSSSSRASTLAPEPGASDQKAYHEYWDSVGEHFPSLKGAVSTVYYARCERLLMQTFFPELRGKSLFKTDLWDEAKNTEILRWAANQGARPFGVDIAPDVVREARRVLDGHRPGFALADIRALPFADSSFDLIYSMGTIEHFPDFDVAVSECYRVLKPGGTAIIGVPNKTDPFLRPLMVHLMNLFKLYDYGMEKSFTHGELKQVLERGGFVVTGASGILFIPGWLRMADLLCHTRFKPLTALTGALVRPFEWLYRYFPAVRRHGYMIAAVARKPMPLV